MTATLLIITLLCVGLTELSIRRARRRARRSARLVRQLEARVAHLESERTRLSQELDVAYANGAALADRSLKRRAALVRIAKHCRADRIVANSVMDAGFKLGDQCNRRDEAIEALTRRVDELMAELKPLRTFYGKFRYAEIESLT